MPRDNKENRPSLVKWTVSLCAPFLFCRKRHSDASNLRSQE
jgi:hypothetical protein